MKKLLRVLAVLLGFGTAFAQAPDPRPPAVAGRFYPASDLALAKEIARCLKGPAPREKGAVVALMVPHAAIEFSGAAAGKAYLLLKKGAFDAVIVIGTGHHKAVEGAAIYPGRYAAAKTVLPYDSALASALMKASPFITVDAKAHDEEHSIEVQVPFIAKALGNVPLVGLVMNSQDLEVARAVGSALAQVAKGKRILLVASSDLSHYPSGAVADIVDKTTLSALETMDSAFFWLTNRLLANRGLPDLSVSYCGEGAVTAVMTAAKALGATRASVLARLNSGDVVSEREYNHVVGYAAVSFLNGGPAPADPRRLDRAEKQELLRLARKSIEDYLATGKAAAAALSADPKYNLPGAVFVTLKDAQGALRGCVGSVVAQESLLESVARNAVAGAVSDSRFTPLTLSELKGVRIEISQLAPPRAVPDFSAVSKGDGVILEKDEHTGVFLPQVWEQIPDKGVFLSELCRQKAGLAADCYKDSSVRLKTFGVDLFEEPGR